MATSNVTVDDTSSFVSYEPAGAWTHISGSDAQEYINSTFSYTELEGATAKFSFNGTGFAIYGAKGQGYGQYLVMVDNQVTSFTDANASGPEYQQVLGAATNLSDQEHTVVLMSAGNGPVDIDAIMCQITAVDPKPNVVPVNGNINNPPAISAGTFSLVSESSVPTASVATGIPAVVVASATAPSATGTQSAKGAISAKSITNVPTAKLLSPPGGASSTASSSSAVLTANANAQTSSLTVSTTSSHTSQSTSAAAASSSGSSSAQNAGSSQAATTSTTHKGLPLGAIIGIAAGILIVFAVLIVLVILWMRRRRAKEQWRRAAALPSPVLPLQDPRKQSYFFSGFGSNSSGSPDNTMREKDIYTTRAPSQTMGYGPAPPIMQAPPPGTRSHASVSSSASRYSSGSGGSRGSTGRMSPYSDRSSGSGGMGAGQPQGQGQGQSMMGGQGQSPDGMPELFRDSVYSDQSVIMGQAIGSESDPTERYSNVVLTPTRPGRSPNPR